MRKILALITALTLVFALCLTLASCGCEHADINLDGVCDECGDSVPRHTECVDANSDAKCDVCNADVECVTCVDVDKNAICDVCGGAVACVACKDVNKDAKCDVCGKDVACRVCIDTTPKDGKYREHQLKSSIICENSKEKRPISRPFLLIFGNIISPNLYVLAFFLLLL